MRAALYVECVGWRPNRHNGLRAPRPWCAEILGPDPRYGLARRFLRPSIDHTYANRSGTRGVHYMWVLSPGSVYEVSHQVGWERTVRRFVAVGDQGEIVDLTEEEVRARWPSDGSESTS